VDEVAFLDAVVLFHGLFKFSDFFFILRPL